MVSSTARDGAVDDLVYAGLALFACGTPDNPKAPKNKGNWRKTQYDPLLTAASLPKAYGVVLPAHIVVIDYDPRKETPDNMNQLERFAKEIGGLPETYMVQSANDEGVHIYILKPAAMRLRSAIPKYPALELKSLGQYMMGEGSELPGGKVYARICGSPETIAPAPEALLKLCERALYAVPDVDDYETEDADAIERAEAKLMRLGAGIGSFAACNILLDEGIRNPEIAIRILREIYNPLRARGVKSDEELLGKFNNAIAYRKSPVGSANPVGDFIGVVVPPEEPKPKGRRTTGAVVGRKVYPDQDWLLEPILPKGLVILAGDPKTGKSWMALDLAMAVADGREVFGGYKPVKAKVAYLALEDTERRLSKRINTISQDYDLSGLILQTTIERYDQKGIDDLVILLKEEPGIKLLIIDTMGRFSPRANKDMAAYDNDVRWLNGLQKLAEAYGLCLLLVHHLRKAASTDPYERILGSTAIMGTMDAAWILDRKRGETNATLHITGRDLETQEIAMKFQPETCQWLSLGDASVFQMSEKRMNILEFVRRVNEPVGPAAVAESLGLTQDSTRQEMRRMAEKGQLTKVGPGRYIAPCAADDFVNASI
jgi:hypothetical protein